LGLAAGIVVKEGLILFRPQIEGKDDALTIDIGAVVHPFLKDAPVRGGIADDDQLRPEMGPLRVHQGRRRFRQAILA
jgi:hypothetical protein